MEPTKVSKPHKYDGLQFQGGLVIVTMAKVSLYKWKKKSTAVSCNRKTIEHSIINLVVARKENLVNF